MVKKGLTALRVLLTQQILLLDKLSVAVNFQSDALHELVPFVQFKKREKQPCKSITLTKVSQQLY